MTLRFRYTAIALAVAGVTLADPVPLTVPILNAKSFVRSRPERAMEPVRSGKAGPLRRRG